MKPTQPTLFTMLMARTAVAAGKPDFSGNWRVNFEKSDFGPMGRPTAFSLKIAHAGDSLKMELQQTGTFGYSSTVPYRTDGSVIQYEVSGMTMKGTADWDGDAVVTRSISSDTGDVIRNRIRLSSDGETLNCRVSADSPMGPLGFLYVFDKQ